MRQDQSGGVACFTAVPSGQPNAGSSIGASSSRERSAGAAPAAFSFSTIGLRIPTQTLGIDSGAHKPLCAPDT